MRSPGALRRLGAGDARGRPAECNGGARGVVPDAVCRNNVPCLEPRDLFEILMRENADRVRSFLLASVRDAATAEDLLQETFLVAWRNLDRYDRQLPFGPWVRGIAGKLLLNHRRRLGRSKVHYCDEESLRDLDRSFETLERLPGDTFDEKLDVLRDCLARLGPPRRQVVSLHYEHGLHCKEIAQRLALGVEAVKKHLQRARTELMRCMEGRVEPEQFAEGNAP